MTYRRLLHTRSQSVGRSKPHLYHAKSMWYAVLKDVPFEVPYSQVTMGPTPQAAYYRLFQHEFLATSRNKRECHICRKPDVHPVHHVT